MKKTIHRLEQYRIQTGRMASTSSHGRNGGFWLPAKLMNRTDTAIPMTIIISDAKAWHIETLGPKRWEHVSASWPDRCPTWSEMSRLKDMLFDSHEVVMQLHPAEASYVNVHKFCLHLWKPLDEPIPVPPPATLGPITGRENLEVIIV